MCPPLEYDPITAAPLSELVAVGTVGTVTTWTWNGEPRAQQPFTQPFAWAMITLDGADTPMLHAVFVDSADDMATGMRVEVVWRDEREGHITDIAGFIPAVDSTTGEPAAMPSDVEQIQSVRTPIRMEYTYTPGRALSQYLRAMKDKRILGDKCPETGEVSVPPVGFRPWPASRHFLNWSTFPTPGTSSRSTSPGFRSRCVPTSPRRMCRRGSSSTVRPSASWVSA